MRSKKQATMSLQYIDQNLAPQQRSQFRLALAQLGACVAVDDVAGFGAALCDQIAYRQYLQYLGSISCIMTQPVRGAVWMPARLLPASWVADG
eukprot:COSAG04_NODE_13563_length_601_cov_0.663347_2_plen_93_part_00